MSVRQMMMGRKPVAGGGVDWRDYLYDYWIVDDAVSSTDLASANGLLPDLPVDVVDSDGFYLTAGQSFTTGISSIHGVVAVVSSLGLGPGQNNPIADVAYSGGWVINVRWGFGTSPPSWPYSISSGSTRAGVGKHPDRELDAGETGVMASGRDAGDARTFILPDDSGTEEWTGTGFNTGVSHLSVGVSSLREFGSTNLRYKMVGFLTGRPERDVIDALWAEYGVSL